jgi:hypothetical protein
MGSPVLILATFETLLRLGLASLEQLEDGRMGINVV